jgi:ABC-type phosphate transport system auxiliary subunit
MKKLVVVVIAMGLFGAMPAFAAENMKMDTKDGMRECALQAESLQQKMTRIQGAIDQGSQKYSAKELRKLKRQLKEANDTLDALEKR